MCIVAVIWPVICIGVSFRIDSVFYFARYEYEMQMHSRHHRNANTKFNVITFKVASRVPLCAFYRTIFSLPINYNIDFIRFFILLFQFPFDFSLVRFALDSCCYVTLSAVSSVVHGSCTILCRSSGRCVWCGHRCNNCRFSLVSVYY